MAPGHHGSCRRKERVGLCHYKVEARSSPRLIISSSARSSLFGELVYISLRSRPYSHPTHSIIIQYIQQSKMASHDPLDLLKASLQSSTPPQLLTAASEPAPTLALAAYLSFASTANPINLPKDTPTRYTSKPGSTSEFYNIGQLYLAWIEKDSGVRDYLIKGQAGGVGYVAITDRRPAVDYLLGKGDGEGRIVAKGEEGASKLVYASIKIVNNNEMHRATASRGFRSVGNG